MWNYNVTYYVPDGYELVEKKENKIKRFNAKKDRLEAVIEACEDRIVEARKELKEVKKELEKLE